MPVWRGCAVEPVEGVLKLGTIPNTVTAKMAVLNFVTPRTQDWESREAGNFFSV